jgi:hypothetical protein
MRDIRSDLQERIEDIARQRTEIQKRLFALDESEKNIRALLEAEEMRCTAEREASLPLFNVEAEEESNNGKYSSPVARFVISFLQHENGDASLEMLKRAAAKEGIPFGGKNPGRVLHFLLTGMHQNGLVERSESGRWRLVQENNGR